MLQFISVRLRFLSIPSIHAFRSVTLQQSYLQYSAYNSHAYWLFVDATELLFVNAKARVFTSVTDKVDQIIEMQTIAV